MGVGGAGEGMEWRRGTLLGLQTEWGGGTRGGAGGWPPARKGIWPFRGGCVRWGGGPGGGCNQGKWREERAGRGSEQETVESPASGEKDGWEPGWWDSGRAQHPGSAGRGGRAAGGFGVRGMPGTGAGGDPGAGAHEASSGKWRFWGGQGQNRGGPSTKRVCVCVCRCVRARAKAP